MEKERTLRMLVLSTLIIVVVTLSIAFAAVSRTLNINGTAKMDTAKWSIYFNNLSSAKITRGAEELGKPNINFDKDIVENIKVKLSNPKDEISYTVDIVNDGTIDAKISMIKNIELTDIQKKIFEFSVTYRSTGVRVKYGDILPAGSSEKIKINIKFKDDITEFDLPKEPQIINLSYQITYTQYDESDNNIPTVPGDGNEIIEDTTFSKGISYDELKNMENPTQAPFLNGNIARSKVESISFVGNTDIPPTALSTVWDASEAKDGSIIGWYEDTDLNNLYEVYIGSNANIYAPSDCSGLFAYFTELKEINLGNFDTSNVTDMTRMFSNCEALVSIYFPNVDFSNVSKYSDMFYGVSSDVHIMFINKTQKEWVISRFPDITNIHLPS